MNTGIKLASVAALGVLLVVSASPRTHRNATPVRRPWVRGRHRAAHGACGAAKFIHGCWSDLACRLDPRRLRPPDLPQQRVGRLDRAVGTRGPFSWEPPRILCATTAGPGLTRAGSAPTEDSPIPGKGARVRFCVLLGSALSDLLVQIHEITLVRHDLRSGAARVVGRCPLHCRPLFWRGCVPSSMGRSRHGENHRPRGRRKRARRC